ncbi:MAG: hypothetical protein HY654_12285, partial [Acidobacteria bacterium]|nr:hypothetical protein [Acidobacteriota bacterium]
MKYWLSLALLFALSLPAVTTRIYASDEIEYFAFLRSLWFDRDVSFENEYRDIYDRGVARPPGFRETFLELTTETGRRINFGTIGCALLWSPFYAVADLSTRARRAAGSTVAADGYSPPYIKAVAYASALYGALSVALSILICQRLWSEASRKGVVGRSFSFVSAHVAPNQAEAWSHEYRLSFLAPALVWVGTPLIFYMYVTPPMAHATSAFTS